MNGTSKEQVDIVRNIYLIHEWHYERTG